MFEDARRRLHRRTLLKSLLFFVGVPAFPDHVLQVRSRGENTDDDFEFGLAGRAWREARRAIRAGLIGAPRRFDTDYPGAPQSGLGEGLFDALYPFVLAARLPLPWRVSTVGGADGFTAPFATIEYPGGCCVILTPTPPEKAARPAVIRGRRGTLVMLERGIRILPEPDRIGAQAGLPCRGIPGSWVAGLEGARNEAVSSARTAAAMILQACADGKAVYLG